MPYLIRNDVTGHVWEASRAEAQMYAIGGTLDTYYSVFAKGGNPVCLCVEELLKD